MKVRLKELGAIFTGNTPSKKVDEYWSNRDIKFIKPDVIKDELCVISSANEYISASAKNVSRIVPANSILVTCIGKIGRVGITEEEVSFNQQINAIVPNEAIIPKYLAYAIYANRKQLKAIANAPVVPIINKTQFSDFKISICESVEKQNKIVRTLDVISGIITHDKKKIEALDELIKARFVEMFGDPSKGDKIKTDKRKIGEIATVTKLAGFEFTKYINYQKEGDIIMLRGLNCKNGHLVLDNIKWIDQAISDALPRSKLYKGDILMTYAGTIGDVAMVDKDNTYHLAPNVGKISINNTNEINPVFLTQLFLNTHDYIMSFASQVAQASINMQKIRDFDYYFPPIELQNQFANFVTQVDKSKFVLSNELTMCDFHIRLIHDRVMHSCINLRVAQ